MPMCAGHIGVKAIRSAVPVFSGEIVAIKNPPEAKNFRRITVTSSDFSSPAYPALRVKGNVENPLPSRCRF